MWEVKCTVCELVDVTCFASFRAQTIAEVLCHVIFFSRHFTDDTGLMHFSFFSLCRWHGRLRFWDMPGYSHVICRYYRCLIKPLFKNSTQTIFKGVPHEWPQILNNVIVWMVPYCAQKKIGAMFCFWDLKGKSIESRFKWIENKLVSNEILSYQ